MFNIKASYKKSYFVLDATSLFCAALFMFSLWDFYFKNIGRPLDYIGIVFVLAEMFFITRGMNRFSSLTKNGVIQFFLLLSMVVIVFSSVVGIFRDQIFSSAAVLVGVLVIFNRMLLANIDLNRLAKFLDLLILLNVIIFIVQLLIFKLFGSVLDISQSVGSISARVYNEGLDYFRPAGLFQEPNSYCTNLFMLMVLRNSIGFNNKYIRWSALFTLLISQSLWGIGAAFLWLLLFVSSTKEKVIVAIVFTISILILLYLGYIDEFVRHSLTLHRLMSIDTDASRQARYGSLSAYFSWDNLLGSGISTTQFQSVAVNGIAFMVYAVGWIGVLVLMSTLFYCFYKSCRLKLFICVLFLLTTYPLMTYMIFWAWLALLLRVSFVLHNKALR